METVRVSNIEAEIMRVNGIVDLMHEKGILVIETNGLKIVLDSNWRPAREVKKDKEPTHQERAAEEFNKHQHKLNMLEGGFDNG